MTPGPVTKNSSISYPTTCNQPAHYQLQQSPRSWAGSSLPTVVPKTSQLTNQSKTRKHSSRTSGNHSTSPLGSYPTSTQRKRNWSHASKLSARRVFARLSRRPSRCCHPASSLSTSLNVRGSTPRSLSRPQSRHWLNWSRRARSAASG
jgi:hypothetical protein